MLYIHVFMYNSWYKIVHVVMWPYYDTSMLPQWHPGHPYWSTVLRRSCSELCWVEGHSCSSSADGAELCIAFDAKGKRWETNKVSTEHTKSHIRRVRAKPWIQCKVKGWQTQSKHTHTSSSLSWAFFFLAPPLDVSTFSLHLTTLLWASAVLWHECW